MESSASAGVQTQDVPAPIAELLACYLDTLYRDKNYAAHLQLYSPAALVIVGPKAFRYEQLERLPAESYVDAIAETAAILDVLGPRANGMRTPTFSLVEAIACCVGESGAGVLARIHEASQDFTFHAGFAIDDSGIVGATVLPDGQLPDLPRLQAMCAAEFAQLPPVGSPDDLYLNGLELAYDRHFVSATQPLRYLPEAQYSCQRCGASCQISRWGVRVTDAARMAIEAMPWTELAPELGDDLFHEVELAEPDPFDNRFSPNSREDGWCVFYDEKVGCKIHAAVGRQPVPVCAKFPLLFTRTPDALEVWTSFHCHAALLNMGTPLAHKEAAMREAIWANRYYVGRIGEQVFLSRPEQPVPWPVYRRIEEAMLGALDQAAPDGGARAVYDKMAWCAALLAELDRSFPEGREGDHAWVDGAISRVDSRKVASAESMGVEHDLATEWFCLLLTYRMPQERIATFLSGEFAALYASLMAGPFAFEPPADLLKRYMRHLIFHKMFLQEGGIVFSFNAAALALATLRLMARKLGHDRHKGEADLSILQHAIQDMELMLVHAQAFYTPAFLHHRANYPRLCSTEISSALIHG